MGVEIQSLERNDFQCFPYSGWSYWPIHFNQRSLRKKHQEGDHGDGRDILADKNIRRHYKMHHSVQDGPHLFRDAAQLPGVPSAKFKLPTDLKPVVSPKSIRVQYNKENRQVWQDKGKQRGMICTMQCSSMKINPGSPTIEQ